MQSTFITDAVFSQQKKDILEIELNNYRRRITQVIVMSHLKKINVGNGPSSLSSSTCFVAVKSLMVSISVLTDDVMLYAKLKRFSALRLIRGSRLTSTFDMRLKL
jgi:uncharacterized membrane protein